MGTINIIVGTSGSGKTAFRDYLITKNLADKVITCTTRKPRQGEIDGVDYHFLTVEQMFDKHEKGELLEPPANFSNNYYAVPLSSINSSKDLIMIVEFTGFHKIVERLTDENINFRTIFMKNSDSDEIFVSKLKGRGSSDSEITERLAIRDVEKTWENYEYDLVLINDYKETKEEMEEQFMDMAKQLRKEKPLMSIK